MYWVSKAYLGYHGTTFIYNTGKLQGVDAGLARKSERRSTPD
jgi:hypothetical protein